MAEGALVAVLAVVTKEQCCGAFEVRDDKLVAAVELIDDSGATGIGGW